jgi:hypothetical protein
VCGVNGVNGSRWTPPKKRWCLWSCSWCCVEWRVGPLELRSRLVRHCRCPQDRLEFVDWARWPLIPVPTILWINCVCRSCRTFFPSAWRCSNGRVKEGPGRVAEVFTGGSTDPIAELRQEGEPVAATSVNNWTPSVPGLVIQ